MSNVTDIKTGLPVVAGVEIAVDEQGRFNLNAIHAASGAGKSKAPNEWLRTQQANEIVAELESQTGNSRFDLIKTMRGGATPGTFAHELLAVEYAGWISPQFRLMVNRVFFDYRTGNLAPAKELSRTDLALMVIESEKEKERITFERDEARRTKALIGSNREATAMARASAETRRANQLQRKLGHEENWKQVKAIPWLAEEFVISRTMYQQVGKKLKAISDEMGLEIDEIPSAEYTVVKSYRIEAINELWRRLQEDGELLAKYRKGRAA